MSSTSSPFPADGSGAPDDHAGVVTDRFADRLAELADRLGTSVAALVLGAAGALMGLGVLAVVVLGDDQSPPELSIPYASTSTLVDPSVASGPSTSEPEVPTEVLVHAAGAVRHPGVYLVAADSRVADLLAAAGGPLPEADLDRVNLAAPVADGSRVYVPAIGEEQPPPIVAGTSGPRGDGSEATGGGTGPERLVDINRATAAELDALPGIGPATAAAIIEHRERHGPFARVDDLLDVRGIGESKFAALRDLVHV